MKRGRIRDFGLVAGIMPTGRYNSITDVEGVGVGHHTLIEGEDVRTGVTAILPHKGNIYEEKVAASVDVFNGYGKSVGLNQLMNEGVIETPIMLTETLNTFKVADVLIDYHYKKYGSNPKSLNSIVGETNGGYLTDNFQRKIGSEEVFDAIGKAIDCNGFVHEGNVGAGTPMTGYGFKGGIGTASRKLDVGTVGALVQLNCGRKEDLRILGAPVGIKVGLEIRPELSTGNSIMMIIATDVALDSRQLNKLAKRAVLGLARTGSFSSNGSGDFTIAFSVGKIELDYFKESIDEPSKGESYLNPLYRGVVEAIEEAILNALFKAETLSGYQGNIRYALPIEETLRVLEMHQLGK